MPSVCKHREAVYTSKGLSAAYSAYGGDEAAHDSMCARHVSNEHLGAQFAQVDGGRSAHELLQPVIFLAAVLARLFYHIQLCDCILAAALAYPSRLFLSFIYPHCSARCPLSRHLDICMLMCQVLQPLCCLAAMLARLFRLLQGFTACIAVMWTAPIEVVDNAIVMVICVFKLASSCMLGLIVLTRLDECIFSAPCGDAAFWAIQTCLICFPWLAECASSFLQRDAHEAMRPWPRFQLRQAGARCAHSPMPMPPLAPLTGCSCISWPVLPLPCASNQQPLQQHGALIHT